MPGVGYFSTIEVSQPVESRLGDFDDLKRSFPRRRELVHAFLVCFPLQDQVPDYKEAFFDIPVVVSA
jgi:hypothetical protein